MEQNERIISLIVKLLQSDLDKAGEQELQLWLSQSPKRKSWFAKITDPAYLQDALLDQQAAEKEILQRLMIRFPEFADVTAKSDDKARVIPLFIRRWAVPAAAVLLIAIGVFYLLRPTSHSTQQLAGNNVINNKVDRAPGRNAATLILANGRKITLDSAKGAIATQGNAIVNNADGVVSYQQNADRKETVSINTLATDRGNQYSIVLPDNTKAWLNASSSITYPTTFADNFRKVEITGEVYFEVAKNKEKPFLVDVAGRSTVEVLGTHFNINAYTDENDIRTTLLEGKVKVTSTLAAAQSKTIFLQPGQQAVSDKQNLQVLENADVDRAVAWHNGLFNFNKVPLSQAMRELARWYDVDIVYENGVPDVIFGGEMERTLSLANALKFLNKTHAHFRLQNRTIIVTP